MEKKKYWWFNAGKWDPVKQKEETYKKGNIAKPYSMEIHNGDLVIPYKDGKLTSLFEVVEEYSDGQEEITVRKISDFESDIDVKTDHLFDYPCFKNNDIQDVSSRVKQQSFFPLTRDQFDEIVKLGRPSSPNNISTPERDQNTRRNFILYGPPGTGKTYKTIDLAAAFCGDEEVDIAKILEYDSIQRNRERREQNQKEFNKNLHKRIHFITFHQNFSYEEFIGGLRPKENMGSLQFNWCPGLFLKACTAAFLLAGVFRGKQSDLSEEMIDGKVDSFLGFCNEYGYKKSDVNFKNAPQVVMVIDEINRANISRVFGELITLIEDDKRLGAENQLIVSLPNGKKFGVPSNLVIIGTMNTADKSIALLDIALRRRFEFIAMYPRPEMVNQNYNDGFIKLNEAIRNDGESGKGIDFQIGHSFFMSDTQISEILDKKVIPLLIEYYMNDLESVKKILKKAGWSIDEEFYKNTGMLKAKEDAPSS